MARRTDPPITPPARPEPGSATGTDHLHLTLPERGGPLDWSGPRAVRHAALP
ncbi:hypothetical protein IHN59_18505, partial [Deinococcus sp. 23YEL01]|nr:hypothetical protein [Deinococcus sp. 23YEL01]